jgi:hypothetical protein
MAHGPITVCYDILFHIFDFFYGTHFIFELALDYLGFGATAGALNPHDILVIGCQDGLQLLREGVRLHFGVYLHHSALVLMCSWIDAGLERNSNAFDDESMDVGDSLGFDDAMLFAVKALERGKVSCQRLLIVWFLEGLILSCIMPLPLETASKT